MVYRVVGANFDQMHMNTNLEWVDNHPNTELVGVCDEDSSTSTGSLQQAVEELDIPRTAVFEDLERCLDSTTPDIVLGCPRNSLHASFVERVTEFDLAAIAIEKPLAVSLADADRMIKAIEDELFVVNWPVTWDPVKHTVKRLVEEGTIGDIREVQYYGGNAGAPPEDSWFYDAKEGGGSMLDYLGYGATFSTWFRGGELPNSVTSERHVPPELDVDVQSSTIARYDDGFATFQTTWRMLTNPWEIQPTPPKGYELVGTDGSISTRVSGHEVYVTTEDDPEGYGVDPDPLPDRYENLVAYIVHLLETDSEPEGPSDPEFCREAHRIVETARQSADAGERLDLVE